MTPPVRYLWRMLVFLAGVAGVAVLLAPQLGQAFAANPLLNALILAVLLLGIAWNLRQVLVLRPEVRWLAAFRAPSADGPALAAPKLLGPMASMFAARRGERGRSAADRPEPTVADRGASAAERLSLSASAMRSVLDGIASRLDESRELSRYVTGLSIFLGLLGTFWGLLLTIESVSAVISGMSVGTGDINALFNQLKEGLAQPLRGMGTAFSASMLGLAGALVLGFLDLTAGQAQSRFYTELEEWLAGLTRLSSGVLGGEGEGGSVPAYVQALLEQTAENLEGLQRIIARGEEGRAASSQAVLTLTDRLAALTDQMRAGQSLMLRVAEQQAALGPALTRLAERGGETVLDAQSRGHLRNADLALSRLADEVTQGRISAVSEIRSEIKVLARTLAAIAEEAPR